MPKTAAKRDRLKEAHERLTQAIQSIVTGEDWPFGEEQPNGLEGCFSSFLGRLRRSGRSLGGNC